MEKSVSFPRKRESIRKEKSRSLKMDSRFRGNDAGLDKSIS